MNYDQQYGSLEAMVSMSDGWGVEVSSPQLLLQAAWRSVELTLDMV